ncbi:MAG TPA: hypothetical protein VKE41_03135 [Roseiflexaceae bacterium]|nr:hypothetical protein [Roseiflexaceae bacterium]
MAKSYQVFVLPNGSYRAGAVGSEGGVPVSLTFGTLAQAQDNIIERQFLPLNERQHSQIEGIAVGLHSERPADQKNLKFLHALLHEGRWRAAHHKPTPGMVQQVMAILNPQLVRPEAAELERAI